MNAPAPEGLSTRSKRLRSIGLAATILLLAGIAVSAAPPTRGAAAVVGSGTIVFASQRSGNSQIYSVHADGSRLGQLTRNRASDTAPIFSPDGRRIVFTRSTNCCGPGLWVMNADGSRQRRLAAYGSDPAWSPDSQPTSALETGRIPTRS
jgi:dipeptidyl aminopeptidase/acylaminoacyl peptidase